MTSNRLVPVLLLAALAACSGAGSNPGSIFQPNPGGGDPGGPGGPGSGPPNGPSGAPVAGGTTLSTNPSIADVSPKGTGISAKTPIVVTFNESIQASTVTSTSLFVRAQQGQAIIPITTTTSVLAGNQVFVLLPAVALPTNSTIEVVASTSILDLDGKPLTVPQGNVIGSFTTELTPGAATNPSVIAVFPTGNTVNAFGGTAGFGSGPSLVPGIPAQIVVVFSKPIAPSTILGDLTPPPDPLKIGFTLTQTFDSDGGGPIAPVTTTLIPGGGGAILPTAGNRVWVATPAAPLQPGSQITVAVGPGTKSDDVVPQSVDPPFFSTFTVAGFAPPDFVNVDLTPATPAELSTTPAALNNVSTLPTYAGNFSIGVVFPAGSLASDLVEIQLHDATSGAFVTFTRNAKAGAGQLNYDNLSVVTNAALGTTSLTQGFVVIAARIRRGTSASAWTVGPPLFLDTAAPQITTVGPPAEGATLFSPVREAAIYGSVSELPATLTYLALESPVGTPLPVPAPTTAAAHLLKSNGTLFSALPLLPAPPVATPSSTMTPPDEPRARAGIVLGDSVGNSGVPLDVTVVHRGRIGGPLLSAQDALTVLVYDEDTLQTSLQTGVTPVVLLDAATPSGSATGQLKRAVSTGTNGQTAARFTAPLDFAPGTAQLTVTATAPGYDLTTVVGVRGSFVSIPIRRTRTATVADPTLTVTFPGAPSLSTVDLGISARPELTDPTFVASVPVSGAPVVADAAVAALRMLFLGAFVRAAPGSGVTYLNDGFTVPAPPLGVSATSATEVAFGQAYSQTTSTSDDPVPVPAAGGITVTLPGSPFVAASLAAPVEVGLVAPGRRVGAPGQLAVGVGRADAVIGLSTAATVNFSPNANAHFFKASGGSVVADPIAPNVAPTDARVTVRAQDTNGNVSRALVRSATAGGPIAGVTLPAIPGTRASTPALPPATDSPTVRWDDSTPTSDGFYVVRLRTKTTTIREWRVYVARVDANTITVPGEASIQLPSLAAYAGTEIGTPAPTAGNNLDQLVDAISLPGLSLTDFFFEDLAAAQPNPAVEAPVTIARGQALVITF